MSKRVNPNRVLCFELLAQASFTDFSTSPTNEFAGFLSLGEKFEVLKEDCNFCLEIAQNC